MMNSKGQDREGNEKTNNHETNQGTEWAREKVNYAEWAENESERNQNRPTSRGE